MTSTNKLSQLKTFTDVVVDTGNIDAIAEYQPLDATTNPSLILKAIDSDRYAPLLKEAITIARKSERSDIEQLDFASTHLAVSVGRAILDLIPGKVSTEVDARLSFDTDKTIDKARQIIRLYEEAGVHRQRVLIKIAATWEGIQAAQTLEKESINCNLTLLFCLAQAVAAAEAGAYLISPFVGRILDWHLADNNIDHCPIEEDPGVQSVKQIYTYYKQHNYKTVVMGASFRNTQQIEALAGCDRLTISPTLLAKLSEDNSPLKRALDPSVKSDQPKTKISQSNFLYSLNEDRMASEKLADGIRLFAADQRKLETKLKSIDT